MKFLSVCSGIEAASVAWGPLGWQAVAFSEIEPFPCALLAHRYPHVPNWGDMNNFREWPHADIDVLCGGTPCQSFSNAGLRKGLDDPRGNLMLVFAAVAAKYRPRWLAWENVPGVLSNNGGRDFAAFLGVLTGRRVTPPKGGWQGTGVLAGIASAYGVAWRVLDAQYAGLAQRRERVFVIGYLGDWRPAAAVLLERHSLRGDPAPSRGTSQNPPAGALRSTDGGSELNHARAHQLVPEVVGALTASDGPNSHGHTGFAGNTPVESGHVIPVEVFGGNNTAGPIDVAPACRAHGTFHYDFESEAFLTAPAATLAGGARQKGVQSLDDVPLMPIVIQERGREGGRNLELGGDVAYALTAPTKGGRRGEMNVRAPMAFKASQFTRGKDGGPQPYAPSLTADADKGDQDNLVLAPIAFQGQMSGTQSANTPQDVSPTINSVSRMAVASPRMAVRRFTPLECERLQGFPEVTERVTIDLCFDYQKSAVSVALQCRRLPASASHVGASESTPPVATAAESSNMPQVGAARPAAVRVRTPSGLLVPVLHSLERSNWFASIAARLKKSLRLRLSEDFAQDVALMLLLLAQEARTGRVASQLSIRPSSQANDGSTVAPAYGVESAEFANAAESDASKATFTTSDLGRLTPASDSPSEILLCSVLAAIGSCTPSETLPASSSFEIDIRTGYTLVPYRNGIAADGPRYKAIGNSWAIPCVRWLGQRIEMVEAVLLENKALGGAALETT